jgi:hypothetical protein
MSGTGWESRCSSIWQAKALSVRDLHVPNIPRFRTGDWLSIQNAFAATPEIVMAQAWRDTLESGFQPGFVRVGRHAKTLWLFATLEDDDIHNAAVHADDLAYDLGDTFEVFVTADHTQYFEFHITPENHRLELAYPYPFACEEANNVSDLMQRFRSRTPLTRSWTRAAADHWMVLLAIPRKLFGEVLNTTWGFWCSRYDWTRGQTEPVLSSTSLHAEPYFHRMLEWGGLEWEGLDWHGVSDKIAGL